MHCQPVLSFLEVRSLVCFAYPAFLACLVSLSARESSDSRVPYDIAIISEFVDVFPDELLGLPPHQEVEFGIDLVLGTTPIFKAPYRLSRTELKELKQQLSETHLKEGEERWPELFTPGTRRTPTGSKRTVHL